MEHLGIDTSVHRHLRLQLYQHETVSPYNYEGFKQYLATNSMSTGSLLEEFRDLNSLDNQGRLLCLIQNHCFFALLDTTLGLLGVRTSVRDFIIQAENDQSWVSMAAFPGKARQAALIRAQDVLRRQNQNSNFLTESQLADAAPCVLALVGWCGVLSQHDEQVLNQVYADLDSVAHLLMQLTDLMNAQRGILVLFTDPDYHLVFSCTVLTQTLRAFVEEIFPQSMRRHVTRNWVSPAAFDAFARLHGWCANRVVGYPGDPCIAALLMSMPSNSLKFHGPDITSVVRELNRTQGQDKSVREAIGRKLYHELAEDTLPPCDDRRCYRLPPTDGNLKPQHRCQAPNTCAFLYLDQQALADVYNRGSYPLLAFDTIQGSLSIKIEEYKDGLSYSALSHVW